MHSSLYTLFTIMRSSHFSVSSLTSFTSLPLLSSLFTFFIIMHPSLFTHYYHALLLSHPLYYHAIISPHTIYYHVYTHLISPYGFSSSPRLHIIWVHSLLLNKVLVVSQIKIILIFVCAVNVKKIKEET